MKKKPARKSAERRPGNTANTSAVKLPPLPTFQRVGGAAAQKAPPQAVKGKKKGAKKESSAEGRVSSVKKATRGVKRTPATRYSSRATVAQQQGLSAQVAELQAQIAALTALVQQPQASPSSVLRHQSSAAEQPAATQPPSTLDSGPSTQLAALSEQIAALRNQLSTLVTRSSSPATSYTPPATAAKPLPIYELKQTRPVGYQSSDLLDSSSEESQDGFFTGLLDRARMHWLIGDWEGLAKLVPTKFSDHRDRANVALIAALGRVQLGDVPGSKECFKFAKKWEVDRRLAISFIYQGALYSLKSARQLKNFALPANKPPAKRLQLPTQRVFVPFDKDKNRERWKGTSNLKDDWNSRTISLAKMIPPHSKVLEFGAGNCILKNHLPPGCEYTPSDLYDRGNGTLVMDLNGEDFEIPEGFDCCVLSGVLEYIIDISRFVKEASKKVPHMIFSYAIYERNKDTHGDWANHFAFNEILEIFERHGYNCSKINNWKRHMLFHFTK